MLFAALRATADAEGESARRLIEEIVELHLPLSDGLARRYLNRGIDGDDLVQVARLALVKAIQRYDLDTGGTFAGFAVPTILGELKRYFRDQGWMVRPTRHVQEIRLAARSCRQRLAQELGHTPTRADVAQALGVPCADLDQAEATDFSFQPLSIDVPDEGRDRSALSVAVAVRDHDLEQVCDHVALLDALGDLDPRTRLILQLRFVEDQTQRDIAEQIGASQMQVSRLLRRTLQQLRQSLEASQPIH
jgi:RNA polymerase sigma-B factor